MKINELKVKLLLNGIVDNLNKAYVNSDNHCCDDHIERARGKIAALLTVVEFEDK